MSFTAFGAVYKATASLLPHAMDSPEAKAMMFAIPMQESRWDERRQIIKLADGTMAPKGPAHGFAQFEMNGVLGVLNHPASRPLILAVLDRLDYDHAPATSYDAITHNDVLMLAYMRCLLWTVPRRLPKRDEVQMAYKQYLFAWRPGAPKPLTWPAFYAEAWSLVA